MRCHQQATIPLSLSLSLARFPTCSNSLPLLHTPIFHSLNFHKFQKHKSENPPSLPPSLSLPPSSPLPNLLLPLYPHGLRFRFYILPSRHPFNVHVPPHPHPQFGDASCFLAAAGAGAFATSAFLNFPFLQFCTYS